MIQASNVLQKSAPGSSPEANGLLTFRKFAGPRGLRAIRDEWRIVQQSIRPRRPFHLYEWFTNYMETLEEDGESVFFFVAYRHDLPVAVFPLKMSSWRIGGLSLRSLGTLSHKQSMASDFVCGNDQAGDDLVPRFLDYLHLQHEDPWDVLIGKRAFHDSALLASIGRCGNFVVMAQETEHYDYLPIGDYQELLRNLSKNSARNLRRAHARVDKMPGVAFQSVDRREDLPGAFEEFLGVEASGWKGAGGTGSTIKLNPCVREFYRGLMQDFSAKWKCRIDLLKAGETCLAGGFCLLVDDTCYFLKTAYNEEFRHLSPGHLLLDYMCRTQSQAGGLRYINLMSDAKWHSFWNPSAIRTFDAYVFRRSMRGLAGAMLLKARMACGRTKRTFQSWAARNHVGAHLEAAAND